jgi:hypothetical protein
MKIPGGAGPETLTGSLAALVKIRLSLKDNQHDKKII